MQRSGAHNELGQQGENLSAEFLVKKGYLLLGRNITNKLGEIDLLMQDGEEIVLVEVKTLRIGGFFNPVDKIDAAKQRKLQLLARAVEADYPGQNIRVDAVAVYWMNNRLQPVITHLENILV